MAIIASTYNLTFLKKDAVAKDTYSFFFERPRQLDFLPGQFLRLNLNLLQPSERGNGRFFSIASSPTETGYLMITVRTGPQIYKQTLLNLNQGDEVRISLPYGQFILKPEETQRHVFLAGGIGITPFRSMIRYAADSHLNIPIILFSSFKTTADIVFQKELRDISAKNSWFMLVETITQSELSAHSWDGNIGRINTDLITKYVTDMKSSLFYIAGPPNMVDEMGLLLKSFGLPDNQIRKERFTGY